MIPLHPRIVHFPVALLLILATLFGVLALVFKTSGISLRKSASGTYCLVLVVQFLPSSPAWWKRKAWFTTKQFTN